MEVNWEKFVEINSIGPKFQNVSLKMLKEDQNETVCNFWLKNMKKSLVLSGDVGRGKSFFMYVLIKELLKKRHIYDVRFFRSKNLDDKLLADIKEFGSNTYLLDQICQVPYLFIDDFGLERASERVGREIYELIDRRLELEKTTVLSSNLDEIGIKDLYGSKVHSRLQEYFWIKFTGKDLRKKGKHEVFR